MSSHQEKKRRPLHHRPAAGAPTTAISTSTSSSSKSPIATPPRAALSGPARAKSDRVEEETASLKGSNDSLSNGPSSSGAAVMENSASTAPASSIPAGTMGSPKSSPPRSVDDRRKILELETELTTMTSEFSSELENLSHKLTNAHESSLFWQQKHSSLNQTFLKTDTDLRLLRAELSSLKQTQEERDREISAQMRRLMLDRDAWRDAHNEAMKEVRVKDELVGVLRGQVRGLKSWVSASSRGGEEQVSDEVVAERWTRLGNELQNWVIIHFRRLRIDVDNLEDNIKEQLLRLVPTYGSYAATSKIHFIQSLVSRILVESIFQVYFVGISREHTDELEKVEKYLGRFGPEESINQWRSTTLTILRKEAPLKLQAATAPIVDSAVNQINNIMTAISDMQPSEIRDQSLVSLINSSIELSRLLRAQKAVFAITMPVIENHQRTMFDPDRMEDIGGEDEDALSESEICCVTFPGIIKAGDENGERGHLKNVVAKTRVLCAPD